MSSAEPLTPVPRWPEPGWTAYAMGKRISVRMTAGGTGPSGGPALRDVVGFLERATSDQPSRWSLRRRTGEVVTIDVSQVVAAKIVPEAPMRLRTASDVDTVTLEKIAAEAWQPLESEPLGGWVLRGAVGFTGRANSVLPLGDPGVPLDEALATVTRWYGDRSLPPRIQVPLPLRTDLDTALDERGWKRHNVVAVLVCDLGLLQRAAREAPGPTPPTTVDISAAPDQAWLAAFRYGDAILPDAVIPMMTKTAHPLFVSARSQRGDTLGIARGAIRGRWLGITAVEVTPDHRRQGLGRRILAELADEAARSGCRHAWLQVAHDNAGARALYDRLGFVAHHDYVYRQQS